VKISEDGGAFGTLQVTQLTGSGGFGTIVINPASNPTLATVAPDFTFTGVTITTNSAALSTIDTLNITGTIQGKVGGHTLTILSSDNNYTTPPGPNYQLDSSASFTTLLAASNSNVYTFKSFATSGANLFGTAHPSPTLTFPLGSTAGSNNASPTLFTATTPFTLTNEADYLSVAVDKLGLTGATTARLQSVPEPASMTMLATGMFGVVGYLRRRRRSESTESAAEEAPAATE
jgi:hypothetical protein